MRAASESVATSHELRMLFRGLRVHRAFRERSGKVAVAEFLEEHRADRSRGTVFTKAVNGDVQAHAVVGQKIELSVKVCGIAPMGDDAMTVDVVFVESEQHPVERRDHSCSGAVHFHSSGFL